MTFEKKNRLLIDKFNCLFKENMNIKSLKIKNVPYLTLSLRKRTFEKCEDNSAGGVTNKMKQL